MKPSIYPIVAEYPGRLFIMPKPSGEWLEEDIQHYAAMGVDLVVSLLEPDEAVELSLQNEDAVCAEAGLDFLNFPIPDRGLPETAGFNRLIDDVTTRLERDQGVAVHCRAGIGRSGMLVCSVLAGFVGCAQTAVEMVTEARGVPVPDTDAQRAFVDGIGRAPS